ncbi:cytochrome P450 71A1-like protein [Tanacetum coccineum]
MKEIPPTQTTILYNIDIEASGAMEDMEGFACVWNKNLNDISKWAIAELIKHPEVIAKATEKLDQVIGQDRWVEEKDMPSLPYIKATLKESLRLHPVTPLLIPRRRREDCKVAGYAIPEDTQILVSVWSIGKGPELWDKPLDFSREIHRERNRYKW